MNVYTHVTQDTQREALGNMDRLLKRRHRCQPEMSNAPDLDRSGAFWLVGADGFEPPTSAL